MARSFGKDVKNNFSRGVVSEFSGLNFPEDAATDASNVVFSRTGVVTRRLGFDYEVNHEFFNVARRGNAPVVQEYIWENVDGNGTLSFAVVQIAQFIYFYQISDTGSLSGNRKPFSVNLFTYGPKNGATDLGAYACAFTQGQGQLFIAHPKVDTLRIKYSGSANGNGTIRVNVINIKIRDLEGVDDEMEVEFRPKQNNRVDEMTNLHRYNLYNQGWYPEIKVQDHPGRVQALKAWRLKRDDFPSNADIWWLSKNANDNFDHTKIDRRVRGTEAPKGHYILDAFDQNRDKVLDLVKKVPNVTSGGQRPSVIAFFAGRMFYGGVAHGEFHDKIYFSQIMVNNRSLKKCYQQEDPTDENSAGLLPSDGGVITIPDVGKVIKMQPLQGFLVIFATNGIWAISGGETSDFRATDYSVRKISDIQTLSASSFVLPKTGFPIWWNADGIFSLQLTVAEGQRQNIEIKSLTDDTIRSLYSDIPANAKKYAKGAYNPLENTIQWVYWSEDPPSSNKNALYHYDRILSLDLDNNSFNFWSFPKDTSGPVICGIISTRGSGVAFEEIVITTDDDEEITDASLDDVTVLDEVVVPLTSSFRYTTLIFDSEVSWDVTFSQTRRDDYLDWVQFDTNGIDYESFFETGYEIRGEAQRPFQSNIVFVYSNAQEGSSCYLQGLWDYSVDDSSGKETSAHQIYIDRSFVGVQRRKIRLRGRGYTLQLRFFSESGKPFNIVGWSSFQSANNIP